MKTYQVDFDYWIPEFGSITLDADTEKEAKTQALELFEKDYPEARDIEVFEIKEII